MKTTDSRWQQHLEGRDPDTAHFALGILTELRRSIAGDGPHCRLPGALESFDEACKILGIPFLKP